MKQPPDWADLIAALADDWDEPWRQHAACQGVDPDMWFLDRGESVLGRPHVVRICDACPVALDCLGYALDRGIHHGIWGGKTERQRKRLGSSGRHRVLVASGRRADVVLHAVAGGWSGSSAA